MTLAVDLRLARTRYTVACYMRSVAVILTQAGYIFHWKAEVTQWSSSRLRDISSPRVQNWWMVLVLVSSDLFFALTETRSWSKLRLCFLLDSGLVGVRDLESEVWSGLEIHAPVPLAAGFYLTEQAWITHSAQSLISLHTQRWCST